MFNQYFVIGSLQSIVCSTARSNRASSSRNSQRRAASCRNFLATQYTTRPRTRVRIPAPIFIVAHRAKEAGLSFQPVSDGNWPAEKSCVLMIQIPFRRVQSLGENSLDFQNEPSPSNMYKDPGRKNKKRGPKKFDLTEFLLLERYSSTGEQQNAASP